MQIIGIIWYADYRNLQIRKKPLSVVHYQIGSLTHNSNFKYWYDSIFNNLSSIYFMHWPWGLADELGGDRPSSLSLYLFPGIANGIAFVPLAILSILPSLLSLTIRLESGPRALCLSPWPQRVRRWILTRDDVLLLNIARCHWWPTIYSDKQAC